VSEPVKRELPLPGHRPLSRRRRNLLALGMAIAIAITVVTAVVVAATSPDAPPSRPFTLVGEDRNAPKALVRAAEAVGFRPIEAPGAGDRLDDPAISERAPLSDDLLPVGSKAPPFTLRTPAGKKVSLSDFRGKVVLLELFATWCPHCAAEAPHLRALAESLPSDRYAIVSIDGSGADAPSVFAYDAYFKLPFPALLDHTPGVSPVRFPKHGKAGPVSRAYRLAYFPTFYVIDPKGRIAWRSDGEQPDALLRRKLEQAAKAT
jgi:peroxiredoxin